MPTDLEIFRNHARQMAGTVHKPECSTTTRGRFGERVVAHPDPACPGCVTDADRALFAQRERTG